MIFKKTAGDVLPFQVAVAKDSRFYFRSLSARCPLLRLNHSVTLHRMLDDYYHRVGGRT
jgi:hypothetical protein